MIRTKPPSDTYRDGWDRIFGGVDRDEEPAPLPTTAVPLTEENFRKAVAAFRELDARRSHESDCPSRIGDPCRCSSEKPRPMDTRRTGHCAGCAMFTTVIGGKCDCPPETETP